MRIRNSYTRSEDIMDDEIAFLAKVSDAFAHPARIKLLRYVMECNKTFKPVCNKDLVEAFGYAQATISQHMQVLVSAGLLKREKKVRSTYYYVNLGEIIRYRDTVAKF